MIQGKPFSSTLGAVALCALLGIAALAPAALAQQPTQVAFSTFELFAGPDSVDLKPDAFKRLADTIRNAQTPGSCPLGRLKIRVAEGDPLFQQALVAARRDAVLTALDRLGIPVAGRLFVETEMIGGPEGHDTVYEIPGDRTPPTLRVRWEPPDGHKVQPNQPIVVRIIAADDADRWQTGIKTIRLIAESDGGRDVEPTPAHFEACSEPPEKRGQATYVVPADPPPVVRLTVLVEDHAGHVVKESANFPTGDFQGTIKWRHSVVGRLARAVTTASADITLTHDGSGALTGRMIGSHTATGEYACPSRTVAPGTIRATLVGSYTPGRDAMMIRASDKETTPMRMEVQCPGARPVVSQHAAFYEFYEQALRGLRPTGDGGFQSTYEQERACEAGSICTTKISLILHRARD
ncbi:MAG: hypothetical protein WD871_03325 [Xanthobacteraceae bacterium]